MDENNNNMERDNTDAIKMIQSKRQSVDSVFKHIGKSVARNITVKDIKDQVKMMLESGKLENQPTTKGLDSLQ